VQDLSSFCELSGALSCASTPCGVLWFGVRVCPLMRAADDVPWPRRRLPLGRALYRLVWCRFLWVCPPVRGRLIGCRCSLRRWAACLAGHFGSLLQVHSLGPDPAVCRLHRKVPPLRACGGCARCCAPQGDVCQVASALLPDLLRGGGLLRDSVSCNTFTPKKKKKKKTARRRRPVISTRMTLPCTGRQWPVCEFCCARLSTPFVQRVARS
jgi:hypothetical protein